MCININKDLYLNLKNYNFLHKSNYNKYLKEIDGAAAASAAALTPTTIWGSISGTIMSGIKLLITDKNSKEYQTLIANYNRNQHAIMPTLNTAYESIKTELGEAGANVKEAGSSLLKWFTEKLQGLKESLGQIFNSIINAVAHAARTAFSFLKGLFERITGADGATEGVWQYFKNNQFLGIPASSWLIWGTIAAFCIIVFTKFVKWLKNRKKTETSESFNNYILNDLQLLEEVRLTEAVSATIYKKAGENAMTLHQDIKEVPEDSLFWKTIKTIGVLFLISLGVYACVMATANGDLGATT